MFCDPCFLGLRYFFDENEDKSGAKFVRKRCENVWCDEALLIFWQPLRNSSRVTRKNLAPDGQNKNVRNGKNTVYNLSFNSKENLATIRFATVAKKGVTSHLPEAARLPFHEP